jgi:hypothetical protein
MEALQRQLTAAQLAVRNAQEDLAKMKADLLAQSAYMRQAQFHWVAPGLHQQGLTYLAALQLHIHEQSIEIEKLCAERAQIQLKCVEHQGQLEGLEEHYMEARREFAAEQIRRDASEADRSWLGRLRPPRRPLPYIGDGI